MSLSYFNSLGPSHSNNKLTTDITSEKKGKRRTYTVRRCGAYSRKIWKGEELWIWPGFFTFLLGIIWEFLNRRRTLLFWITDWTGLGWTFGEYKFLRRKSAQIKNTENERRMSDTSLCLTTFLPQNQSLLPPPFHVSPPPSTVFDTLRSTHPFNFPSDPLLLTDPCCWRWRWWQRRRRRKVWWQ